MLICDVLDILAAVLMLRFILPVLLLSILMLGKTSASTADEDPVNAIPLIKLDSALKHYRGTEEDLNLVIEGKEISLLFNQDRTRIFCYGEDIDFVQLVKRDQQKLEMINVWTTPTKLAAFGRKSGNLYTVHSFGFFSARLSVYGADTGKEIVSHAISPTTNSLAVNSDESVVAYTSDKLIHLRAADNLKKLLVGWETVKPVQAVFSPLNRDLLMTVDESMNKISLWKASRDSLITKIEAGKPHDPLRSADFMNNGQDILLESQMGGRQHLSIDSALRAASSSGNLSDLNSEQKKISVSPQPIIAWTPETGVLLGGGAQIFFQDMNPVKGGSRERPPFRLQPSVSYGFRGSQIFASLLAEGFLSNNFYLRNEISSVTRGSNAFFGIGPDESLSERINYSSNIFRIQGELTRIFADRIHVGVNYRFRYDAFHGDEYRRIEAPGVEGGPLFGIGPHVRYDNRNSILFPTQGSFFSVAFQRYGMLSLGNYQYNDLQVDLRKYFPTDFISRNSVIAFQAIYHSVSGGDAPFYELPYLSGDRLLRGQWKNLYIDQQMAMLQAEYRGLFHPADARWAYSVFMGIGDVSPDFFGGDYRFRPKTVFGLGFRQQLFPKQPLYSRFDFALTGKGQFGVFVGAGVAF